MTSKPATLPANLEAHFFNQMSLMVGAGIPITKSLEFLAEGTHEKLTRLAHESLLKLESGHNLRSAFSEQGLSVITLALLETAETGGLGPTLKMAGQFAEESANFQRRFRAAITYPIFVFSVNLLLALAVLVGLVPLFKNIVDEDKTPLVTRILFQFSDILRSPYAWVIGIFLLWEIKKFFLRWKKGKYTMDFFRSVPGLRGLILEIQRARFWSIFSTMFQAGAPIPLCSRLAGEGSGSERFQKLHLELYAKFRASGPLNDHFSKYSDEYGSLMVGGMALIAEGRAGKTFCESLSKHYEIEVEHLVERFHALIEPLLICLVAVTTGGLLMALYLPFAQFVDELLTL